MRVAQAVPLVYTGGLRPKTTSRRGFGVRLAAHPFMLNGIKKLLDEIILETAKGLGPTIYRPKYGSSKKAVLPKTRTWSSKDSGKCKMEDKEVVMSEISKTLTGIERTDIYKGAGTVYAIAVKYYGDLEVIIEEFNKNYINFIKAEPYKTWFDIKTGKQECLWVVKGSIVYKYPNNAEGMFYTPDMAARKFEELVKEGWQIERCD